MIDVYDLRSIARQPKLREAMHELRYHQFYEKQSWDVPAIKGIEIDQYDRLSADPVYILVHDEKDGKVIGTCRLLKTTGPYMVKDNFSHMMDGHPLPGDDSIWEANRIAVDTRAGLGLTGMMKVTGLLLAAICEYCIPKGVTKTIGSYEPQMIRLLKSRGAKADWVGPIHEYPDSKFAVATHPINWDVYNAGMKLNGFAGPVISHDYTEIEKVAA